MSTNALFSNSTSRSSSKNLVEFKAGKMTMKGKMVYPDTRKGQLYVYQSDDSLMHFCWKDRTTGIVEDDLIIFPDDCEFRHVSQCKTGRVYLLKFKSSSRKFFFWLQDIKTDKDEEYCRKINEVLNNPPAPGLQRINGGNPEGDLQNLLNNMSQQQLLQLFGGVGQIGGLGSLLGSMTRPLTGSRIPSAASLNPVATAVTRSPTSLTPSPPTVTSETSKSIGTNDTIQTPRLTVPNDNRIHLSDLQNYLSGLPTPLNVDSTHQREIATELSASIPAAISTTDNLEGTLNPYLPCGDSLSITLSSPQFSQALSMFWVAFQSGQVAPVIQQFGLGSETVKAANSGNIEDFVNALEAEIKNQQSTSNSTKDASNVRNILSSNIVKSSEPSNHTNDDKKDDDEEGMNLD